MLSAPLSPQGVDYAEAMAIYVALEIFIEAKRVGKACLIVKSDLKVVQTDLELNSSLKGLGDGRKFF
ncbi:hypothetical protein V6N13_025487 [Hibiscus sabdariffa]